MKVRNEIIIEKGIESAWEVMGNGFAQIHIWASFFKDSKSSGESKFKGIDFSAREVVVEGGNNTNTLDTYDVKNHMLSYTVTAGAPPFANKAEAQWSLTQIDLNSCKATIVINMELKEAVPASKAEEVEKWLQISGDNMLEEMKYYVETGNLHERKLNVSS